ncbi:Ig-like domain-containing protein [Actinomadura soli]|uniref:Ig-like domain-containing protein n=1 Tax=Actinomadura soli TaxID=2508997 RepID=UPI00148691A6|nr:Ig-like domain-containing protein [Actinomadura soli]
MTAGSVLFGGLTAVPAWAADTAAPDATIDRPALHDEVFGRTGLTFAGTATDDTGVASVGIAFQDRVSRLWYRPDGTWGPYHRFTAALAVPNAVKSAWSYTWTPPSAGAYTVQVVAKDTAGHPDAVLPWRRFDVDTSPPDTVIRTPAASSTTIRRGQTATISGYARDDHGVLYVYKAIQNRATGKWLRTGGTWGAIMWHRLPVLRPGATLTDWSFGQGMTVSGSFLIQVRASDRAGLVDPTPASRVYTVTG